MRIREKYANKTIDWFKINLTSAKSQTSHKWENILFEDTKCDAVGGCGENTIKTDVKIIK